MKPVIRCSELPRLLACNGSRILVDLVKPRKGDESYEGTYGHWLIAARAIDELGAMPPAGGLRPPEVPGNYKFPKSSEWVVNWCFSQLKHSTPAEWALEVEVPLAYEFDRFILSGHVDALAVSLDGTEVAGDDWKLGYKQVDPAHLNDQVLGYIVLLRRAYATSLRKATFRINQPRNDEETGFARVSEVVVEGDELTACVESLERRINAALDNEREVNSGMVQCAWCPVGIQCPAIQADIHSMRATITDEILAGIRNEPDDALLGELVVAARTVRRSVEDAEELLGDRLDKVKSIITRSGMCITCKHEGGKYKATDPLAVYANLQGILPAHTLANVIGYPVTRIKDAIAETMDIPKSGKAALTAESVFAAKFGHLFEQGTRRKLIFS